MAPGSVGGVHKGPEQRGPELRVPEAWQSCVGSDRLPRRPEQMPERRTPLRALT